MVGTASPAPGWGFPPSPPRDRYEIPMEPDPGYAEYFLIAMTGVVPGEAPAALADGGGVVAPRGPHGPGGREKTSAGAPPVSPRRASSRRAGLGTPASAGRDPRVVGRSGVFPPGVASTRP